MKRKKKKKGWSVIGCIVVIAIKGSDHAHSQKVHVIKQNDSVRTDKQFHFKFNGAFPSAIPYLAR